MCVYVVHLIRVAFPPVVLNGYFYFMNINERRENDLTSNNKWNQLADWFDTCTRWLPTTCHLACSGETRQEAMQAPLNE